MPYIKKEDRVPLDNAISKLVIDNEGDLNYTITRLCHIFLKNKGLKYSTLNTLIGALECAKLELYAKKARPYEEYKEKINGSVE